MRSFFTLILVIYTTSVFSLETDNYLVWDRDLEDSSREINALFKQEINEVLKIVNLRSVKTGCRELTFKIARRFKTYPPMKIFIEDWLIQHLPPEKIYPSNMNYISESIYKNTYGAFFKRIPLSPNIQVKDIYFGTDKLSHFTSTSRSYLKKYLKSIESGLSEEDAVRKAIDVGIFKETTILGLKAIGVYSYGDLEANYQGFRFYKNLCLNEGESYLTQNTKGKWEILKYPDISDYVSPYWDESFNLSFRSSKNWAHTSREIAKKYCSIAKTPRVQQRMNEYSQRLNPSFSVLYIQELQNQLSSRTPIPEIKQSFDKLCE